eukprot:gene9838-18415_t
MPESSKDIPNCRIIIDCTEFRIETLRKDLEAAATSYSNNKQRLTAKLELVLPDKGFMIHDLIPRDVFLNLPPFLSGKSKFTKEEALLQENLKLTDPGGKSN